MPSLETFGRGFPTLRARSSDGTGGKHAGISKMSQPESMLHRFINMDELAVEVQTPQYVI